MLFGNKGLVIEQLKKNLHHVQGLHDQLLQHNVLMFQQYRHDYNLLAEEYNALLLKRKNDQQAYHAYSQHLDATDATMNFNFEKKQKEIVRLRDENETLKKENAHFRKTLLGED